MTKPACVTKNKQYMSAIFWDTPSHRHAFYEIILICEGEAVHTVNGSAYRLKAGNIMLMRPDDVHEYKIADVHNYLQYDLYATDMDFTGTYRMLTGEDGHAPLSSQPIVISLEQSMTEALRDRFKYLDYLTCQTDAGRARPIYLSLLAFIQGLFIAEQTDRNRNIPDWYRTIVLGITRPEVIAGTVEQLARLTNFSHGYLCKLFKAYTGERLIDYFTKCKIDYALRLLNNKDLNILEISNICGYDSLSHFTRTFKRYCNLPPHEYRKKVLNL